MKLIINQNERVFLFKNGIYQRILSPGKHYIKSFLGETFVRQNLDKAIKIPGVDTEVLLNDPEFAKITLQLNVPDGFIAVRFEDGRVCGVHESGKYLYFNVYNKITYELFDLSKMEIEDLSVEQINRLPKEVYTKIIINEGEIGLLFFDGKFNCELTSGAYYFWNNKINIGCEKIDLRMQEIEINGQEILTADKVMLRINFICHYKIIDALKLVSEVKNYKDRIYTITQLAVREYVCKYTFDELLKQKEKIAATVLIQLQSYKDTLSIEFTNAGIKDIILPGEIRDIMNTVLIAEKNAQASVITRREEVASTRSLLNTAKLLDENATLYKLKELEYLEKICEKVGTISVGGTNLIGELQKVINNENKK